MERHLKTTLAMLLVALLASRLWAVSTDPSTAFPFLSVGMGPRAVAMGENFTAVSDDFLAIHYNPAGLSQMAQPQVILMHNTYLADGFYDDLGLAYPLGDTGTLAAGLSYMNYGSVELRDTLGNLRGSYTPFDIGFTGAFGFSLNRQISMGLGSRWVRQDINGSPHMGLMWEVGFLDRPNDRFSVGVNLRNLGLETGGYSLPSEMLFGAAYRFSFAPKDAQELLVSVGGNLGIQGGERLGIGLEYGLEGAAFARCGYQLDLFNAPPGALSGLSFGTGIKIFDLDLDYSFTFQGDLGDLHRFSVSFWLPAAPKVKRTSPGGDAAAPPPPPNDLDHYSNPDLPPSLAQPGQGPVPLGAGNAPNPAAVTLKFQVASEEGLSAQQLFDLGEAKLRMGLKKEAMDYYLRALEKDPHFDKALGRLGRLYFDQSLESYRKLLELDPQNDRLREWLKRYPR